MTLINQQDTFANNYGTVHRSSAIFWYRYGPGYRTTISLLNYWPIKRGFEVKLHYTIRDMGGVSRCWNEWSAGELAADGSVINIDSQIVGYDSFEGSIEVVAINKHTNMVIPYLAATAIYETPRGISMVHSYSRAYNAEEVAAGRALTQGHEACWSLRDTENVRSFGVLHNGPRAIRGGKFELRIRRHTGLQTRAIMNMDAEPYETIRVVPRDVLMDGAGVDLLEFLDGKPGNASCSFETGDSFTRMLVGHERCDGSDMQVTHSNFDYSRHETDMLEDGTVGYMHVPDGLGQLLVYPDSAAGTYEWLKSQRGTYEFRRNGAINFPGFPSRLVTGLLGYGLRGYQTEPVLPYECSLGVITKRQPPKRFWWGCCDASSRLIVHDLPEVYGGCPPDIGVHLSVFTANSAEPFTHFPFQWSWFRERFPDGMPLTECEGAVASMGSQPAYYVLQSDYGGLTCYSTLERKDTGSMTLEHGF